MINLTNCPVCNASSFKESLICEDYTVSHERFTIVRCQNCEFQFTNPRPANEVIGGYYKSDDYISHSNTKKGIVARMYHAVRNYTLKKKIRLVSAHVSRGTILDYGCGTGMFLKVCSDAGWKTFGMEPDSGARAIATSMGLTLFSDKAHLSSSIPESRFDAITLWHVLEHVTDLDETLNFFKQYLKDNGVLIIAVPNHKSFDAEYYKKFWAAYDVPRHLYHFHEQTIEKLLGRFEFKLIETLPMKFDSFYVSMLSEKYKTGSVNYFKAFKIGLSSNLKAKKSGDYSSLIYVFKKQ